MRISDWSSDVCSSDLFDRNRALFPKLEHDVHAVLQEFMRVADDILADVDLFEAVLVHEHQIVALGIEELEILGVEAHLFDRVGAAKTVDRKSTRLNSSH